MQLKTPDISGDWRSRKQTCAIEAPHSSYHQESDWQIPKQCKQGNKQKGGTRKQLNASNYGGEEKNKLNTI